MSENRKWVSIVSDAKKGEASEKNVVSSDFRDVRMRSIEESGTGHTRVTYHVKGMWKDIFSSKGTDYDTLSVPDAGRMHREGAPEIPQEGLFVAVPENAEVKEVKVIGKKEKELDGSYYMLPASKPVREGEEPDYTPKKEIYESDTLFPGKYIEFLGTKHVAGRKVAHIIVYLVQYKPKSKSAKALQSIDLEVVYETHPQMDAKVRKKLLRKSPMDKMILDSRSVIQGEKLRDDMEKETNPDPPGLHDLDNEGEYLIITTEDLKDSVSALASARDMYTVKIVTKEEILQEFPAAKEDAAIRKFLVYATENWAVPPEWVVLAGSVSKIPTHIAHFGTPGYTSEDLASDHYYADLSGDLMPEIVVSRLPVSNAEDMETICSRAASYSQNGGEWGNKILLAAHEDSTYRKCTNAVAKIIGRHFEVIKMYGGRTDKEEVVNTLNRGVIIANYRGHGSDTAWRADNGLEAGDVRNLANSDMIPLVFSIACWNAHIDMDGECFGETWIKNEKAITFLGASRPSWTFPNHDFAEYLFDAIINQGITQAGYIMNWAKTKLFLNYPKSTARDNIRMYLLLGDPCADVRLQEGNG